jgi:hypothetical protein
MLVLDRLRNLIQHSFVRIGLIDLQKDNVTHCLWTRGDADNGRNTWREAQCRPTAPLSKLRRYRTLAQITILVYGRTL